MSGTEDTIRPSDRQPSQRLELGPGVWVWPTAMRIQYARSRGPGGQNVNKVNSKAEIWLPINAIAGLTDRAVARLRSSAGKRLTIEDEIHIAADSHRSQEQNREEVIGRLRAMIAAAIHEPKPRRKTKPSKASKARRIEQKRHRGQIKSNRRAGGKSVWDH